LNSGPGAIGGAFIHEKHHNGDLPRFAGWWGYDKPTRFKMEKGFKPMPGAEGWQLSTPAMFLYAAHRASLEIFEEAGWSKILAKQKFLTNYLWFQLDEINNSSDKKIIEFITPRNENDRGCQASMLMLEKGKEKNIRRLQKKINKMAMAGSNASDSLLLTDAPKKETEAEGSVAGLRQTHDLLLNDCQTALRNYVGKCREILSDGAGVGEQTIRGDESSNCGKHSQQQIEYRTGANCQQSILADLIISTPENVLPASHGYLGRRCCFATPTRFIRAGIL